MISLLLCSHSIHTPAVVVVVVMHSTSKSSIAHHHPSPVPMSSQLIRQIPRVSQCPDRPPPETALESSASECNLLPGDRRLVQLLARSPRPAHACCVHMHRGRAIPKGHLQFMPARTGSTSRFATPLSARLPSHAFPCGRLDLGHGSTKKGTRTYHACEEESLSYV